MSSGLTVSAHRHAAFSSCNRGAILHKEIQTVKMTHRFSAQKSQHRAEQTCTYDLQIEKNTSHTNFYRVIRKSCTKYTAKNIYIKKNHKHQKITPHSLDSYTHLWCTGLASLVQHAQHFWFYPIHQKNTLKTANLWKQANNWQVQTIIFKKHHWVQISTHIFRLSHQHNSV